ncbi:MAG: FAD-binding oxidoreductase [Rhodoferax sp.]
MMRDMVLGLEVVLADGRIVASLNHLIKNNTGYDLKQLFIGSEGTLDVITRLVLRLREKPGSTNMAFVARASFDVVPRFLKHMDRALGGTLSAFEVMWQSYYQLVTTAPASGRPPVAPDHPYYALVESQGADNTLDSLRFNAAMEHYAHTLRAALPGIGLEKKPFLGFSRSAGELALMPGRRDFLTRNRDFLTAEPELADSRCASFARPWSPHTTNGVPPRAPGKSGQEPGKAIQGGHTPGESGQEQNE